MYYQKSQQRRQYGMGDNKLTKQTLRGTIHCVNFGTDGKPVMQGCLSGNTTNALHHFNRQTILKLKLNKLLQSVLRLPLEMWTQLK